MSETSLSRSLSASWYSTRGECSHTSLFTSTLCHEMSFLTLRSLPKLRSCAHDILSHALYLCRMSCPQPGLARVDIVAISPQKGSSVEVDAIIRQQMREGIGRTSLPRRDQMREDDGHDPDTRYFNDASTNKAGASPNFDFSEEEIKHLLNNSDTSLLHGAPACPLGGMGASSRIEDRAARPQDTVFTLKLDPGQRVHASAAPTSPGAQSLQSIAMPDMSSLLTSQPMPGQRSKSAPRFFENQQEPGPGKLTDHRYK